VLDNINPSLGLGIAGTRRLLIDSDQGFADGRRHLPAVTADIDDAVPPEEIPDLPALGPDPVLHERHLAVRSVGEGRQHRRNAGPSPLLELLPVEVVDLGMVGAEEKQSGPDLLAALLLGGYLTAQSACSSDAVCCCAWPHQPLGLSPESKYIKARAKSGTPGTLVDFQGVPNLSVPPWPTVRA